MAYGWFEAGWLRTRVLDVPVAACPQELDGLRIAHLSDFHLGPPSRGARRGAAGGRLGARAEARSHRRHRRPALAPARARAARRGASRPRRVRGAREPRRRRHARSVLSRCPRSAACRRRCSTTTSRLLDLRGVPVQLAGTAPRPCGLASRTRSGRRVPHPPQPLPAPARTWLPARARRPHARRPDRAALPGREAPPRAPPLAADRGPVPRRRTSRCTSRPASARPSSRSGSSRGPRRPSWFCEDWPDGRTCRHLRRRARELRRRRGSRGGRRPRSRRERAAPPRGR